MTGRSDQTLKTPVWRKVVSLISNTALDAPLVAASWWLLFAMAFDREVEWKILPALFPAVWTIYLFDRVYDAGNLQEEAPLRKRFANERAAFLKGMLALASLLAGGFGVFVLKDLWIQTGVIALVTTGYFVICRWKEKATKIPMKEGLTGFCFAAGVGIPFEIPVNWMKIGGLIVFGLLCWMNCLIISRAEAEYDRIDDPTAWFASGRRSFPFVMFFAATTSGTVFLGMLGLPAILVVALILAHTFLLPVLRGPREFAQSLADAALWIAGVVGVILSVLFR